MDSMLSVALLFGLLALNAAMLFLLSRRRAAGDATESARRVMRAELKDARSEAADHARRTREELVEHLERVRATVDDRLREIRQGNETKLEQMRRTVDEKLESTLHKRLGESFELVGQRLEAVQRGLGEMRQLARGVGDLKRVLTNVKIRGTFGEVQLEALLEQILTPEQYGKNVRVREGTGESVEFAVRLPGPDGDYDNPVWLPIDAKFPQEDYGRMIDAVERADRPGADAARAALLRRARDDARLIHDKYLNPPATTDFAIMFLPTEGLYAEVIREPGLVEGLQRDWRIVVAGPTTLAATLSSLRMGFRTLAIEQRSSEVWKVLGAVKTEFRKFGEQLDKVKQHLDHASSGLEQTGVRSRQMERKLREVESSPAADSASLLDLDRVEH